METNPQVITEYDPQALSYCPYCNLHTTTDNFDKDNQMCLQCLEKLKLEQDNGNHQAKK